MKITKISPWDGNQYTYDIAITQDQLRAHENGELIQNVAPHLEAWEREFLKTGYSKEQQDIIFAPPDDEEDYG